MTSGAFVLYGELRDQSSLKLSTITDRQKNMAINKMRAIHPGEILREEYLAPLGMSAHALSMALHVPAPRIHDIVRERRAFTPDTALRLARYFNTTAQFWLNLQSSFDLKQAEDNLGKLIQQEIRPLSKRAA
jgi:addiction module HigA family antidote